MSAAFLDEAITWRDLGYHWHWSRRKDTESFERALPAWALKTLADHADDEREYVYTPAEWEAGATHDPLWNAAQRELVVTRHHPQLPAHAVGQEGDRVVPLA